jgi:hypothetical protein
VHQLVEFDLEADAFKKRKSKLLHSREKLYLCLPSASGGLTWQG